MNKETLVKAGLITAGLVGLGYFTYRFVKEMKQQIKDIQEAAELEKESFEKEKEELKATIQLRDDQLALAEDHIDQLVFGTPDENGEQIENAELEEMRRRQTRSIFDRPEVVDIEPVPSEDDDFHQGSEQTANEEVEHHNVWKENEYFNTGDEDIPYFVVESAKDLKGNEGQSMRHDTDPNSVEAWNQYKAVMISELYDDAKSAQYVSERYNMGLLLSRPNIESIIDTFSELLEVNDTRIVQPYNQFDNNTWEEVYERREDFFGTDTYYASSQFPVTFGELLFEYACHFVEDTEAGERLPMIAYMLYESGILNAENIEQKLLIISKVLQHRNVQVIPNSSMKKLGMFGRVVEVVEDTDTGFDVRLYNEYNEFLGRAIDFEEAWREQYGDDEEDE